MWTFWQIFHNTHFVQVVFPKFAKEYSHKLGVSSWDLVEEKRNVVTGFSGTRDSSLLLPTTITEQDPTNQLQTNALVLSYLLRPENSCYIAIHDDNRVHLSATSVIRAIVSEEKEVRILLDIGAQVRHLEKGYIRPLYPPNMDSPDVGIKQRRRHSGMALAQT